MNPLDETLLTYFKHSPHMASFFGLRDYDFLVPRLNKQEVEETINDMVDLLGKLKSYEPDNEELMLDRDQFIRELKQEYIIIEGWKVWKSYPSAPDVITEMLLSIMFSDANEKHKEEALKARIRAIPKMLEESKELLEEPYSLWVSLAQMQIQGLRLMLLDLNVPNEVLLALEDYSKWLSSLEPKEGFKPLGEELFEELMEARGIEESSEALASWAKKEAERLRSELGEEPKGVEVERPEEAYLEAVNRARRFVKEKAIAPLAPDEEIEAKETPEPLKPIIPFAAYYPPQRFSPFNKGTLIITPGASKRDYFDILNTAVHETYPGHHLQLTFPLPTKYRAFANATDYVEGWAHYSEELMLEQGFESHPRYVWQVKKDSLWRLVRVYVDVWLSKGKMSFEDAVKELVEVAMLDEQSAKAEVLRYTLTPGYQLSYAYGKRRIKEMREMVMQEGKFSLYDFHERLLRFGALPVDVVKELIL